MRLLLMLRALALGALLGVAGWHGVHHLLHEGRPARLLERAIDAAPADPSTGVTLVFLFRPSECPNVMSVLDLLNNLPAARFRVVGGLIVEQYRMPDWRTLVEAAQIRFPVYRLDPGKARASTGALGYASAPLLLLFDREGRVLLATDALETTGLRDVIDGLVRRLPAVPDHSRLRA
jgi:hypothetical protein